MDVVREGVCLECGYDLCGLPLSGRCPECGNAYDSTTRAGFGSAIANRQEKLDRTLARARTGCLAFVALSALMCAGVAAVGGYSQPARAFTVGIVFALFFAFTALVSFLYEKPDK